ncbi:MAG: hypothetical protein EPN41_07045 [Candidimonas sp.]|nr:MAG: hypothetical protein EPN41_07045 [Candidimonas sp.]
MNTSPDFPLLGEPLALDLANTRICRQGTVVDLLRNASGLTSWLRAERERLVWRGRATAEDFTAVATLRDTIDALLHAKCASATTPQAAVDALNRILTKPVPDQYLTWNAAGPKRAMASGSSAVRRQLLLHTLACDALEVLTGRDAPRLRKCRQPGCRLLFIAHNPRRLWCSGTSCGNRARVARHYRQSHPG